MAGGLFTMIFFLGCDIAKLKLDVSLVNEQGIEQWADKISNDPATIATFLLTLTGHYLDDNITCVVEATGRYHYSLLEAAMAAHVPIKVYNPLLTKQGVKASVRGKKTDRTDALLIARLGLRGEGRLYSGEPFMVTKLHARSYQKLGVVSNILARHTEHLQAMHEDGLTTSVQETFDAIQASITAARKTLYQELTASASGPTFTKLQTIPGVGPYVAASLIGEIQSMERFNTAHALTAFAGLDPRIRQSGKVLNSTGRLTKRGSSYLRRSIFIAAHAAKRYDPNFKALYDKKRAEGKSYTVATIVVARKLLSVIRAVWLSKENYDVGFNRQDS
jgi:transposase